MSFEFIIVSFKITGIYVLFQQGMLLGWLRIFFANLFDHAMPKEWSRYVQKPLWDCLPCMGSLWTCLLTWSFRIDLMIAVCGLNYLIQRAIICEDE